MPAGEGAAHRRRAGSIELGRFVAPMTTTCARVFKPSISVRSCDTIRRSTSPCKALTYAQDMSRAL